MPEYRETLKSIQLPPGIGIDGYLAAIRQILAKGKVKSLTLELGGQVSYKRFMLVDEPEEETQEVKFKEIIPYNVIRVKPIVELQYPVGEPAPFVLSRLFFAVATDGLNAIAFVCSTSSTFSRWHLATTGPAHIGVGDTAYGLPVLRDPEIPDEALLLCAAYNKSSPLSDTIKSYKIAMPIGEYDANHD